MADNTTPRAPKQAATATKKVSSSTEAWSIAIIVLIIVILIAYVILMWECFKQQKFIFKKYPDPQPESGSYFYPRGGTVKLTKDEINDRNKFINNAINKK